ncbi:uncharacterized protein LOC111236672 [Seriola dumerili]|uniref:uncharacterized protein LOC111236672 n=1 Tax=Seriola dumerili TaxID=41447 RepID=UPI000BBE50E1|nr:uncharacterized protein LOC111236672 [Seriola dumerili]
MSTVTCTNNYTLVSDSGEYWCEAAGGERSNTVTITVTGGSVILESPVLPVMEGESVSLRCRTRKNVSDLTANFYKDGLLIGNSSTGNITIESVSRSDDGLYKCNISGAGESPQSRLMVTGGSVILESPVLPVMEGESVSLRCRTRKNVSDLTADFYKDGLLIGSSSTGNITIESVSMSDDGLYKSLHKETSPSTDHSVYIFLPFRTVFITVSLVLQLLVVALFHFGKGSHDDWIQVLHKVKPFVFIQRLRLHVLVNKTAEPGATVILPCRAPSSTNIIVVEWSRPELGTEYVFMFRDRRSVPENQHPSFQNRVDLNDRQMKDGDVSMILKNVTSNDTGKYECRVDEGRTNRWKRANLNTESISIIYLDVHQSGHTARDREDGGNKTLLIGVSVALFVALLVAVLVGFMICRKRRGSYQPPADETL